MQFAPAEKAFPIRQPSTANLFIDSADRDEGIDGTAGNFRIARNQSILNGYFTRIGISEVVLNWNVPNITNDNSGAILDISGLANPLVVTIPVGCYTCADVLNTFVSVFNALPAGTRGNMTLSVSSTGQIVTLTAAGNVFSLPFANAGGFLGLPPTGLNFTLGGSLSSTNTTQTGAIVTFGLLQPYQYLDFLSPELTYNQELKDSTTGPLVFDSLCRWYMSSTTDSPQFDSLGFPIVMGYKPFSIRRIFSPPKQIRWEPNQPIGQLSFQVYSNGRQLFDVPGYEWAMTLQVSEV
jgi:hypothetical protein